MANCFRFSESGKRLTSPLPNESPAKRLKEDGAESEATKVEPMDAETDDIAKWTVSFLVGLGWFFG